MYHVGNTKNYLIGLMVLFNFASRQTAFYFTAVISLGIFVTAFTKLSFKDGRPFMWVTSIFPYICELEFGNPATETMNAVAITFSTGLFLKNKLSNSDEYLSLCQKLGVCLAVIFGIIFVMTYSLQGIYNGTNSIDAVLFGVELGLFIAIYSHYFIRERLDKHITKLMDGLRGESYKQAKLTFASGFALLFLAVTFEYVICMVGFEPKPAWIYQISVKCPVSQQLYELIFADAVYAEYGLICYIAGSYLGLVYDAQHRKGTIRRVNKTSFKAKILRVVISAAVVVPCFVLPLFLIKDNFGVFLVLIIKYQAPAFVTGYLLYGHIKVVYDKFGLLNNEDITQGEAGLTVGQIEKKEDFKDITGRRTHSMYDEGLNDKSTF